MNIEHQKSETPEDIDTISTQIAVGFAALQSAERENVRIDLVKHKAMERKWLASAGHKDRPYLEAEGETPIGALAALRTKILDALESNAKRLHEAADSMTIADRSSP